MTSRRPTTGCEVHSLIRSEPHPIFHTPQYHHHRAQADQHPADGSAIQRPEPFPLSGVHDFDNIVDYRLQLLLSDVLGRKVKQQNSGIREVEDDGLGRTRLFLR